MIYCGARDFGVAQLECSFRRNGRVSSLAAVRRRITRRTTFLYIVPPFYNCFEH